ncbi:hypothetical protein DICVIV_13025 [Dictyocaulus viviparus]|uniref:Uncharacterized protein n=1 Tax=Dictyocaulus viviparus TaxID=29172 RepID=A0A0D8XEZ2_DICVI|nr:hypothetical protein DICVIV_13025 [Dictyocaulus viviparus]
MLQHLLTSSVRYLRLIALLCLLHSLIHKTTAVDYTDFSTTTKYCYSCMSEDFLLHWPYLDEVYYRPMNFTDYCFKIPAKVNIGMTPCSHSLCVTMNLAIDKFLLIAVDSLEYFRSVLFVVDSLTLHGRDGRDLPKGALEA